MLGWREVLISFGLIGLGSGIVLGVQQVKRRRLAEMRPNAEVRGMLHALWYKGVLTPEGALNNPPPPLVLKTFQGDWNAVMEGVSSGRINAPEGHNHAIGDLEITGEMNRPTMAALENAIKTHSARGATPWRNTVEKARK